MDADGVDAERVKVDPGPKSLGVKASTLRDRQAPAQTPAP
jgi:hypothetical protein